MTMTAAGSVKRIAHSASDKSDSWSTSSPGKDLRLLAHLDSIHPAEAFECLAQNSSLCPVAIDSHSAC